MNKINKPLARMTKEKRHKEEGKERQRQRQRDRERMEHKSVQNIKSEGGDITTTTERCKH